MNQTTNEVCEAIGLNESEWVALSDRFTDPSCTVDALSDDGSYHPQDVETVVEMLAAGELNRAMVASESITRAILEDAIEGSTYAAGSFDPENPKRPEYVAACKALQGAAKKVARYTGTRLNRIPLH